MSFSAPEIFIKFTFLDFIQPGTLMGVHHEIKPTFNDFEEEKILLKKWKCLPCHPRDYNLSVEGENTYTITWKLFMHPNGHTHHINVKKKFDDDDDREREIGR